MIDQEFINELKIIDNILSMRASSLELDRLISESLEESIASDKDGPLSAIKYILLNHEFISPHLSKLVNKKYPKLADKLDKLLVLK